MRQRPASNSKPSRGLYDPEKMVECRKKAEAIKKAKETFNGEFKRQRSQINFDIAKMEGVNLWEFGAFLENGQNRQELLKVFKYLIQIKREGVDPICLTDLTLETMDKLVNVPNDAFSEMVKNSATRSEKLVEKQIKNANVNVFGDAFLFGEEGVEEILIIEDGYKCAGSLLHPQSVITFLQNIIAALENLLKSEQNGNFKETINSVVEYLDNQEKQSSHEKQQKSAEIQQPKQKTTVPNHSKGLKEEWSNTLATLKQKGVRKDLEDFAIWLLRPTHIDGMVQIILFITGLESAVDVSLMALDLLGIGDFFTKAMEKIGVDLEVATGIKPGVVMWAFGPNGVLPLFMRYGESESKETSLFYQKLVDKAGQEHKVIKMAVEHELEFLKKIVLELIEHKGHPMHELMDNLLGNFRKMDAAIQSTWDAHITHWEQRWKFIESQMNAKSIREDLKKFAVWFVTPDRVNDLFQLILTATNLDIPVYLALSLMELFGVNDIIEKKLNMVDKKLQNSQFAKDHQRTEKAIEFMIGKDGLVPLFIKSGDLSSEEWREDKNEYAADVIKIAGNVLIKHKSPAMLIPALFLLLKDTVEGDEFYMEVFQKWNLWNENHHKKLQKAGLVPADQNSENVKENSAESEEKENQDKFGFFNNCLPIFGGKWKSATEKGHQNKELVWHRLVSKKENDEFVCKVHSPNGWSDEKKEENEKGENNANNQNGQQNVKNANIEKQNNLDDTPKMSQNQIEKVAAVHKQIRQQNSFKNGHQLHSPSSPNHSHLKQQKSSVGHNSHHKQDQNGQEGSLNKSSSLKKSPTLGKSTSLKKSPSLGERSQA